jgi:isoaspartyl peptidase/L-asparaginase-like protein (Ntn-hydrolase superfamily)
LHAFGAAQQTHSPRLRTIGTETLANRDFDAGVIAIDKAGNCASGYTTRRMIHGWIEHGSEAVCRF